MHRRIIADVPSAFRGHLDHPHSEQTDPLELVRSALAFQVRLYRRIVDFEPVAGAECLNRAHALHSGQELRDGAMVVNEGSGLRDVFQDFVAGLAITGDGTQIDSSAMSETGIPATVSTRVNTGNPFLKISFTPMAFAGNDTTLCETQPIEFESPFALAEFPVRQLLSVIVHIHQRVDMRMPRARLTVESDLNGVHTAQQQCLVIAQKRP